MGVYKNIKFVFLFLIIAALNCTGSMDGMQAYCIHPQKSKNSASQLLASLCAGHLTKKQVLQDNYPASLSLSSEEKSEFLGNLNPSSPGRSPQAKPLLRIPRMQAPNTNQSCYQKPIVASMNPGKTGDICGSTIELYTTHQR